MSEKSSAQYSPMSFWFLNHDLHDDELRWQLREVKDKGFKGVFIHPRDGLNVPYQSELWWEKVNVIMDCCSGLGIHAWLYDEDPYPSGAAGSKVFVDHPEFKARELIMETAETEETEGGRIQTHFSMGKMVKIVAIRMEGDALTRQWLDLTSHVGILRTQWQPGYVHHNTYYPPYEDFGNPHWRSMTMNPRYGLDCVVPEGRWKICAFIEREIGGDPWGGYTDLLNPKAVRYFMQLTHDKFSERYEPLFGNLIPGIFTDEPKVKGIVSWTEGFAGYFLSLFGYDIRNRLPDLWVLIDRETVQIRHDYRLALGRLFRESYVVPISDWCGERGILNTGHISPEEDPIGQTRYAPYLLATLKQFHLPGTDLIAGNIGGFNYPLLHLGPKLASSAAHHAGRIGVMAEAFGANGWELDLQAMRKMADWLFVMGVTDIVSHGQFYSIDGLRKKEAPPSLFYQSSHWPYFLPFSQYLSKMSELLKDGTHHCRLLVYYPQATFSAYYPDRIEELERCSEHFGGVIHELLSRQWDFDLIDEETLLQLTIEDGRLHSAKESYEVLLLAACDYLESGVASYCKRFASQGGKVWIVGEEPEIVRSLGDQEIEPGDTGVVPFFSKATDPARLVSELEAEVAREILVVEDGHANAVGRPMKDIYVHVRKLAGAKRLFVLNALEQWREGKLHHPAVSEASPALRFVLPPNGSMMFDIREDGTIELPLGGHLLEEIEIAYGEVERSSVCGQQEMDISDEWVMTPQSPNVLNVSHWHFWDEDPRLTRKAITTAPVVNVLKTAGLARSSAYWAFARFYTQGPVTETKLVFDQSAWEGKCIIRVNGHPIPEASRVRRYDVNNFEVDVTSWIKQGNDYPQLNWIEVSFPGGGRLLEPFRLYGDFQLELPYSGFPPGLLKYGEKSTALKRLQSWGDIGYPYYAGTMAYEKEIVLPDVNGDNRIYLYVESIQDVGILIVNGVATAPRYSQPLAWNLTGMLQPGLNRLRLEVANGLVGLLEGSLKKSGINGTIKLVKTQQHYGGSEA